MALNCLSLMRERKGSLEYLTKNISDFSLQLYLYIYL